MHLCIWPVLFRIESVDIMGPDRAGEPGNVIRACESEQAHARARNNFAKEWGGNPMEARGEWAE